MAHKTIMVLRIILVATAIVIILAGLLYAINGSLETFPTDEQQGKAKIAAVLIIILGAVLGTASLLLKPKKMK